GKGAVLSTSRIDSTTDPVVIKIVDEDEWEEEEEENLHGSIEDHDNILPLLYSFKDKRKGRGKTLMDIVAKFPARMIPEEIVRNVDAEVIRGLMHL
ncbi:hypothetical protein BGX23_005557, partial [Mortierella sp. AD031]